MKMPAPVIFSILFALKNYSISAYLYSYLISNYIVSFIGCSVIRSVFSFKFVLFSITISFQYPFLIEINSLSIFYILCLHTIIIDDCILILIFVLIFLKLSGTGGIGFFIIKIDFSFKHVKFCEFSQ